MATACTPFLVSARRPGAATKIKAHRREAGSEKEQDPKYAIRLLVDIAIKALSPAINDPTTAVQALDQIEDLLLRLGQRQLEVGASFDSDCTPRLLVPLPGWDDLLGLAFEEICFCGATSIQVMRRMNALVRDLMRSLPEARHPALKRWNQRLNILSNARSRVSRKGWRLPRQTARGSGYPV